MAMIAAMIAFAIDSMLPAMGEIAAELTPTAPHRVQWILSSFFLGMGLGTLVAGPIADAIGRRSTILGGTAIYCLGAALAYSATTFEGVIAARMLQGLGVAGPRIASMAVTRDLYAGRHMARVMSLTMMVFTLVPAAAPLIGSWIMGAFGWRAIFLSFICFAVAVGTWFALRQGETLPRHRRRPFCVAAILRGLQEVLSLPQVTRATMALVCAFTMVFLHITTSQLVFEHYFNRAEIFPICFALIALLGAAAGYINARVVLRIGMRRLVMGALLTQSALSFAMLVLVIFQLPQSVMFPAYLFWIWSAFMTAGLTIGNLNAIGLEPLGHIAGLASSIISACATVGAVILVFPASLLFDGTPFVPALVIAVCGLVGFAVILRTSEQIAN